jgi:hypothetical protein
LLFADTRLAWFWLLVRLYTGWQWLDAGIGKISNPAWTGSSAGSALTGFINGAISKSSGDSPTVDPPTPARRLVGRRSVAAAAPGHARRARHLDAARRNAGSRRREAHHLSTDLRTGWTRPTPDGVRRTGRGPLAPRAPAPAGHPAPKSRDESG